MKRKAFTLVELIVVITILAILWTIAFIALSGYSKEARDAKRVTDTSSLLSKINIEETRWTPISELITYTRDVHLKILWETGSLVKTFWEADFKTLKEDEKNFRDPSNKSQNYPMAYAFWGSGRDAYKFIEIASVSEKENRNIIKWNYYKLEDNDDESLFLSGSIKYTEKPDSDLVYELEWINPKEDWEGVLWADCKWKTEDSYVLEDTKNWEEITVTKIDSDITWWKLSATKNFLCKDWKFIWEWEVEVINITCNDYYYPEKDECKHFKPNPMNDPNNIWIVRLVDWKLWTQNSYYLDSVTWLAWAKEVKEELAWATSNAHQQPIWNWTEYSYPSWPESEYPAFEYCRSLGSKWRIPTTKELVTLVTFKGFNENWWQSIHPDIKSTTLVNSLEEHYFKSKPTELDKSLYIYFWIWDINSELKNIERSVLCVHDLWEVWNWIKWLRDENKKDWRFKEIANLNWTWAVIDINTNKYWTRWNIWKNKYSINKENPEPVWNKTTKSYDYNGKTASEYPAFEACTKVWAWWRIPTYYELLTLVDYENKNSSDLTTSLEYIKENLHWSSTRLIKNTNKHQAFFSSFFDWTTGHNNENWIEVEREVICIHD